MSDDRVTFGFRGALLLALAGFAAALARRRRTLGASPPPTPFRYAADEDTVYLDLVDLEHCGFDHELYEDELWLHDVLEPGARWPRTLVVRFRDGAARPGEGLGE